MWEREQGEEGRKRWEMEGVWRGEREEERGEGERVGWHF